MSSEDPASNENLANQMLKELQSWWEIPAIAQYISLFRESFNLPEIEIEELENGLIDDSLQGPSKWLEDLLYSYLRTILPGRVNVENWHLQLQKLVTRNWPVPAENPFLQTSSFSDLKLRSKVEIIYSLCLYRLDKNDIVDRMKSMDADALRVQALGVDDAGSTYWYFYGTRLYKEEPNVKSKTWDEEWEKQKETSFKKRGRGRPRKVKHVIKSDGESDDFEDVDGRKGNGYMNVNAKSRWSVVCDTIEEWVNFAEKYKNSKSKNEKELFRVVQENFLPTLNKIYEEKERKLQQKIRELMPAREKIITRRETRKLRGEVFESSPVYPEYYYSNEAPKARIVKDRAQRLEERNRRASESMNQSFKQDRCKRLRYSDDYYSSDYGTVFKKGENQNATEDYSRAFVPRTDDKSVDLQTQVSKLLSEVKLHKDAWPFLYPVKEDQAPGYYEIIKEPMDLSKIESRLYGGYYETLGELDSDFSQIVTNCEHYNGLNHAYSKMAQSLWKMFRKGISMILDAISDEDPNKDSGENTENSNQDSIAASEPSPKSYKKSKDGRKKKKKTRMEALEILAHASELAIQSTNSNDMLRDSNAFEEQDETGDFLGLKVLPIHSHPPDLVEKFSSESSNDNTTENSGSNSSSPSYVEEDNLNEESHPNKTEIPVLSDSTSYANNNLSQLSNFIEKNNSKNLNILSNNDVSNVLSETSSSQHESNSNSSGSESSFSKADSPVNLDSGITNILDACNDNVSNIISHLMKQPIYNAENQLLSESKDCNTETYVNTTKQNNSMYKNIRKSPITSASNFTGHSVSDNLNPECSVGSLVNISTVDASSIGITSFKAFPNKAKFSHLLDVPPNDNFVSNDNGIRQASTGQSEIIIPKPSNPYRPKQQTPHNEVIQDQYYETSSVSTGNQADNVPNVSYQSLNMGHSNSVSNTQATFIPSAAINSGPHIPLQIPTSFSKILQSQVRNQNHPQNNSFAKVNVSSPGSHVVYVSEPNNTGLTYHVYTQSKTGQNVVEEHTDFQGNAGSATHMPPNQQHQFADNQEKIGNRRTPPKKKSPVSQQFQATSFHVPSKSIISSSASSSCSPRTSLPVTSSNFVPVSSLSYNSSKDKSSVKRMKVQEVNQAVSGDTIPLQTSNMNSSINEPNFNGSNSLNNSQLYQTVPIVLSGYNQPSSDARLKNNQGIPVGIQSNLCLPNSLPIVQQVLIPGAQQFPVQNSGQFVFTTPQNSVNKLFNKGQNIQISSNIRQIDQGVGKIVPQLVGSTPIMQITKDNLMQGFQLQSVPQNNAQTYTQVAPNPQFVSIPTYMITNPNPLQDPTAQTVMNVQSYQLPQRRQMQLNGQGNG